jgi:hypothetical protein
MEIDIINMSTIVARLKHPRRGASACNDMMVGGVQYLHMVMAAGLF